jgi:hypothetical protein
MNTDAFKKATKDAVLLTPIQRRLLRSAEKGDIDEVVICLDTGVDIETKGIFMYT